MKKVIINADDFGLSSTVNRAISQAFRNELISDTTLLAGFDSFEEAVTLAYNCGFFDKVGVHFNLNTGKPLTEEIKNVSMFCKNGFFHGQINRLKPLNSFEKSSVYKELHAQAEKIKAVGFKIDHADSHHHIHTALFIAPIVIDVCKEFGINKIRIHRNIGNIKTYKKTVKRIYNKSLRKKGFKTTDFFGDLDDILDTIPENLEIMVHPDYDKNGVLIDRRGMEGEKPIGIPLYSVTNKFCAQLISYGDL